MMSTNPKDRPTASYVLKKLQKIKTDVEETQDGAEELRVLEANDEAAGGEEQPVEEQHVDEEGVEDQHVDEEGEREELRVQLVKWRGKQLNGRGTQEGAGGGEERQLEEQHVEEERVEEEEVDFGRRGNIVRYKTRQHLHRI